MAVAATGFGAGSRELDGLPNAVQVVVGTASAATPATDGGQPVQLLEANVDDVTGEVLAHVVASLVAAGAHDAWLTPVIGKKGRPAHIVTALCDPGRVTALRELLAVETGTLGIRTRELQRWVAPRRFEEVEVDGYPVRVKIGPHRVKAEHDDVARVAGLLGLPLREIARRAEQLAEPPQPGRLSR
jgi:uncharacterized protein (DUF111 family)